jgi:UDP-N-acetylglucosamine 2-epimerase (non-hydrolysing)
MSKKILGVVGARPNFMKMDAVLRPLEADPDFSTILVHTGQHYDEGMSRVFFRDLGLRSPDVNLGVGSGSHAQQTGMVMIQLEKILEQESPDLVIVVGDVNSTMAAAITAAKLNIPVAHVEAGLRSFDRTMPEEINRIVTDAISTYLFTTSPDADENLLREGILQERIFLVGNVMIDTMRRCLGAAEQSTALETLGVNKKGYALLTLHRPGNVDQPLILAEILTALEAIQRRIPIVFPRHPRTESQIRNFGFQSRFQAMPNLRVVPPLGYLDFLKLETHARFVLTDSGGIQEETTVLGVPCLTLRENTERPITVTQGTNQLVGNDQKKIISTALALLNGQEPQGRIPELWDGFASRRLAAVLKSVKI